MQVTVTEQDMIFSPIFSLLKKTCFSLRFLMLIGVESCFSTFIKKQ
jgi:hypothetical protein